LETGTGKKVPPGEKGKRLKVFFVVVQSATSMQHKWRQNIQYNAPQHDDIAHHESGHNAALHNVTQNKEFRQMTHIGCNDTPHSITLCNDRQHKTSSITTRSMTALAIMTFSVTILNLTTISIVILGISTLSVMSVSTRNTKGGSINVPLTSCLTGLD